MKRPLKALLVLAAVQWCFGSAVRAQSGNARLARSGEIKGIVRLPGGSPAPRGMMVTLEVDPVGYVAQSQTDSQGKFSFFGVNSPGTYVVKVRQMGYRDAAQRVDLTVTPNGYVVFDLIPSHSNPVFTITGTVHASVLSAPDGAARELEKGQKLLLEEKQPEKSLRHFQKAVEMYPAFSYAYFLMGTAYLDLQKFAEGQAALEKAVYLDEKLAAAHLALGKSLTMQGRHAEAEGPLRRVLEMSPDAPQGNFELANVYWALGRWQDAEPLVRKALEKEPGMAEGHVLLGNILLRKRDAQGALAEFREYLRKEPKGRLAARATEMVAKIENALAAPR